MNSIQDMYNYNSNTDLNLDLDNLVDFKKESIKIKKPNVKRFKKMKRMTEYNFKILNFSEYETLTKYNFNVKQLKQLCKHYSLRVTGNKSILHERIYTFLRNSSYAIIIQKYIRGFFVRTLLKLQGPALIKRHICVNDSDFYSLDDITDIPSRQFYSFRDKNNLVYGFDICSLFNLWDLHKKNTKNPYTQILLPDDTIQKLRKINKLSKIIGVNINIDIDYNEYTSNISPSQQVNNNIETLFQRIDELGFYTNSSWLTSLSRIELIYFYRNLWDIWNYRANLSHDVKGRICPGTFSPFINYNISLLYLKTELEIKEAIHDYIYNLISMGIEQNDRWLGASYVLTALTLVSHDAAQSLPWLYESVAP